MMNWMCEKGYSVLRAKQEIRQAQEANTQVELLNELGKYMNEPGNRYQPIPSNVGLTDESSTELINEYIANGIMGLYAYWFRQKNPELSLDAFTEMAKASMTESIRLIRHG